MLAATGLLWAAFVQDPEFAQEPRPVALELQLFRGVEMATLPEDAEVFLGETLTVWIDLTVDPDYLADGIVPRFRRPLDLEIELATPWLEGGQGYRVLDYRPSVEESNSLVIDRAPGTLASSMGGAGRTYRLERRILITEPQWSLQPAVARWTSAERYTEDMVRGRIPVDPQEKEASTPAWSGTAVEPPITSAPGFHGAIGDFESRFLATSPTADGLVQLTWTFTGFGALAADQLPQFTTMEGAQVVARRTSTAEGALLLHLELRPLPESEVFRLPSWTTFHPTSGELVVYTFPPTRWEGLDGDAEVVGMHSSLAVEAPADPVVPEAVADDPASRTDLAETQLPDHLVPLLLGTSLLIGVILLLVAKREPREAVPEPVLPTAPPRPHDGFDQVAEALGMDRDTLYSEGLADQLGRIGLARDLQDQVLTMIIARRRALFAGLGTAPSDEDWLALGERLQQARR